VRIKLSSIPFAKKAAIVNEKENSVWVRVYPQAGATRNGELARSVGDISLKEGWKIEELHTEEGRLDEVFRAITLPDTVTAKS
jgi:ABC-2 type transport system ATP-binding protein